MSSKPRGTIEEKLERHTTKAGPDDCWIWTGIRSQYGMPQLGHQDRSYMCRRRGRV